VQRRASQGDGFRCGICVIKSERLPEVKQKEGCILLIDDEETILEIGRELPDEQGV
jgi:hypothetical protein